MWWSASSRYTSTPLLCSVSHTPSSPKTCRARVAESTPASTARAGSEASTAKQISPRWFRSAATMASVISFRHAAGNSVRAEGANRCLSRRITTSPASGGATAPAESTAAAPAATAEAAAPESASAEAAPAERRAAPATAAPATVVGVASRPGKAGQAEQQADQRADPAHHQAAGEQQRGAAGCAGAHDAAQRARCAREHPAHHLGDDERREQPDEPATAAGRLATVGGHRLRQRLAVDQRDQHPGRLDDATGEVARAEAWHQVFLDHPR